MLEHLRTGDDELLRKLGQVCERLTQSAALLERLLGGERGEEDLLARKIHEVDQAAHEIAQDVDTRTFRAFIIRVDRMEMHGLAVALDAAVEAVEESAQLATALHASGAPSSLLSLARTLTQSTETLGRAVPSAGGSSRDLRPRIEEMGRLEEAGEAQYEAGMKTLFAGAPDPVVVLRWKDMYEKLRDALRSSVTTLRLLEQLATSNH